MKYLKKLSFILLFSLFNILFYSVILNGSMQPLVINGKQITLKDGSTVSISTDYDISGGQFRAVWVSALTGEVSGFSSEESFKIQFYQIFEKMEYYHLNAMLFHIRMMNDAFYESEYNSYSSYYSVNATWDPLPWLIEECHKRGIEFHAWMNPYRVTTKVSSSLEEIADSFIASNAASNPNNLLKGTSVVILNPGLKVVRDFLIRTCMEVVEKYDVDAIHFDDYFYASGINDAQTVSDIEHNPNKLTADNFRRNAIDLFIEELSSKMRDYNLENNKRVQLGISPTGSYRNGNGVVTYDSSGNAISSGSNTNAYSHYGSPLYADTLKWINEEWIDYIIPQTYWGITNSSGPFCELVSWWNKVVKYKKVNLYVALGLYMSSDTNNASWSTNPYEGYHQIMYSNTLENIKGICVYNFASLSSSAGKASKAFNKVDEIWNKPVIPVSILTMPKINVNSISELRIEKTEVSYNLVFDKVSNSKFYVIYRSTSPITFDEEEVIDIIGDVSVDGVIKYPDLINDDKTYYYGVKVLSISNDLSEGVSISTNQTTESELIDLKTDLNLNTTSNLLEKETVKVFFKNSYYPFGQKMKYNLYYDFGSSQTKITSFTSYQGMNSTDIFIPKGVSNMQIILEAYNNVSCTKSYFNFPIGKALPKVTNFSSVGNIYINETSTFVFNSIDVSSCVYTLQMSKDQIEWVDVTSITSTNTFNQTIKAKINTEPGNTYFRIAASNENGKSYSSSIRHYLTGYFEPFKEFTVNGQRITKNSIIRIKANEKLDITYTRNSSQTNYSLFYSSNYAHWFSMNLYTTSYQTTSNGNSMKSSITINNSYVKFYVKIVALYNQTQTESYILEVYVDVNYLFSDGASSFMVDEVSSSIRETGLFK